MAIEAWLAAINYNERERRREFINDLRAVGAEQANFDAYLDQLR